MLTNAMISLIVPAYNEVQRIGETLTAMQTYLARQPYDYEIIVAADGDDGTRELAGRHALRNPRICVLGTPERSGKGRGIRNSVAIARGQVIGFLDADYKVAVDELEQFLPWFE